MAAGVVVAPGATIARGEYTLERVLGSGSFATVYSARQNGSSGGGHGGGLVAVKAIARERLRMRKLHENLESEISLLKDFRHPNIVCLLGVSHDEGSIFLILEYCGGGDLHGYLRTHGKLAEPVASHFTGQLASGLRYLWQRNTMHRDLKPQNLLLSSKSPTAVLKIADFGFARHLSSAEALAETLCGSPLYMAPEILEGKRYDNKADLWSAGAILYEMLMGRPPYGGASQVELLRNIQSKPVYLPPLSAPGADSSSSSSSSSSSPIMSDACRECIMMLLKATPEERCSYEEFFASPFVTLPQIADHGGKTLSGNPQQRQASTSFPLSTTHHRRPPPTPRSHPFMPLTASPPTTKTLAHGLITDGGGMPPLNLGVPLRLHDELNSNPLTGSDDYVMVDECIDPYPISTRRLYQNQPKQKQQNMSQQLVKQQGPLGLRGAPSSCPGGGAAVSLSNSESMRLLEAGILCLQIVEVLGKRAVTLAQLGDASVVAALQAQHSSYIAGHVSVVLRIAGEKGKSADLRLGLDEFARHPEVRDAFSLAAIDALETDISRRFSEAWALYLKSLGMIKSSILRAKQVKDVVLAAISSPGTAVANGVQQAHDQEKELQERANLMHHTVAWSEDLLQWQNQQFRAVLDRAEQCRTKLKAMQDESLRSSPSHGPRAKAAAASSPSVNELVLRAALQLGEEASLDEAMGLWAQGKERLQKAVFLLESLMIDPKPPSPQGLGGTLSQGILHEKHGAVMSSGPLSGSLSSPPAPGIFATTGDVADDCASFTSILDTFNRRMEAMSRRLSLKK